MKVRLHDEDRINVVTVGKLDQVYFNLLEKAVSTDTVRCQLLSFFYDYESKVIVSTDGRRLVIVDVTKLYLIDSLPTSNARMEYNKGLLYVYKADCSGIFPSYKKVVPSDNLLETNGIEYDFSKKHQTLAISKLLCDYSCPVDLQYLLDLEGCTYKVKASGTSSIRPLVLYNEVVTAVVMPVMYEFNRIMEQVIQEEEESKEEKQAV
ncbi:MAG: hypothetical protein JJE49_09565 [Peptostreptococcaceae bacterium]|nr:hypothetical protein [Peptostreptococcaceae bacterium]